MQLRDESPTFMSMRVDDDDERDEEEAQPPTVPPLTAPPPHVTFYAPQESSSPAAVTNPPGPQLPGSSTDHLGGIPVVGAAGVTPEEEMLFEQGLPTVLDDITLAALVAEEVYHDSDEPRDYTACLRRIQDLWQELGSESEAQREIMIIDRELVCIASNLELCNYGLRPGNTAGPELAKVHRRRKT